MYVGAKVDPKAKVRKARTQDVFRRDPIHDVRSNLARLEARAMQLCGGTGMRVQRNLDAVCETSRRLRKEASMYASGTDSQASVELFMAGMGFNVQEQQRLLQQITASRSTAMDTEQVTAAATDSDTPYPRDLDGFLASKRNEALMRAVDDVHRVIVEREKQEVEDFMTELWEKRKKQLATQFGMRSLVDSGAANQSEALVANVTGATSPSRSGGFVATAAQIQKALDFTQIVATSPSSEWLSRTTDLVTTEQNAPEDVVQLWLGVESMLGPMVQQYDQATDAPQSVRASMGRGGTEGTGTAVGTRRSVSMGALESPAHPHHRSILPHSASAMEMTSSQGASPNVIAMVSTSRHVLERQYLHLVLQKACKIHPSKFAEYSRMHAEKMKQVIIDFCARPYEQAPEDEHRPYTKRSPTWTETFVAMRCGRYDAAALLVPDHSVRTALEKIAEQPTATRNSSSSLSFDHLIDVYQRDETRTDPYRAAVLLILLAGRVGNNDEASKQALQSVMDKVTSFADDVLWLRLCLVRHVQGYDARVPKLQSLVELQNQLLSDQTSLFRMVNGRTMKVVSMLFFALLPSTALRLLVKDERTFLDGVQLSLIFDSQRLLTTTPAERDFDLSGVLLRLGNYLLNSSGRPTAGSRPATTYLFQYFFKAKCVQSFIDLCNNPVACTRFFGRPDAATREGELLSGTPSEELLETMLVIGDQAAAKGNIKTAVHVLLILSSVATSVKNPALAKEGLLKVLQCVCPLLVQSVHNASQAADVVEALDYATMVRQALGNARVDLGLAGEVEAFQSLCTIAQFHRACATSEPESAISVFFSLPFVPSSMSEVEAKARWFNTQVSDDVRAATPNTLLAAYRIIAVLYDRCPVGEEKRRLHASAQALRLWQSKWRYHVGHDIANQLAQYADLSAYH